MVPMIMMAIDQRMLLLLLLLLVLDRRFQPMVLLLLLLQECKQLDHLVEGAVAVEREMALGVQRR